MSHLMVLLPSEKRRIDVSGSDLYKKQFSSVEKKVVL